MYVILFHWIIHEKGKSYCSSKIIKDGLAIFLTDINVNKEFLIMKLIYTLVMFLKYLYFQPLQSFCACNHFLNFEALKLLFLVNSCSSPCFKILIVYFVKFSYFKNFVYEIFYKIYDTSFILDKDIQEIFYSTTWTF